MIAYIRGILTEKEKDGVVVEAGSVGYYIRVPLTVLEELPAAGAEVKIYTHMQVREDDVSLFGFSDRQELEFFRELISVNGVGPKGALAILSVLRAPELQYAIYTGDVKAITKAQGIGQRTAQRIVLELKEKVGVPSHPDGESFLAEEGLGESGSGQNAQDAIEALTALGYSRQEAGKAVSKAGITEDMDPDEVLKRALRHLSFI